MKWVSLGYTTPTNLNSWICMNMSSFCLSFRHQSIWFDVMGMGNEIGYLTNNFSQTHICFCKLCLFPSCEYLGWTIWLYSMFREGLKPQQRYSWTLWEDLKSHHLILKSMQWMVHEIHVWWLFFLMDQMDGTNRQLAGTWTLRLWDIFYFINTCNSDFWVIDDFDEVIFLIWSLPSAELPLWACRAQDMKVKVSFYCPRGSDHQPMMLLETSPDAMHAHMHRW